MRTETNLWLQDIQKQLECVKKHRPISLPEIEALDAAENILQILQAKGIQTTEQLFAWLNV